MMLDNSKAFYLMHLEILLAKIGYFGFSNDVVISVIDCRSPGREKVLHKGLIWGGGGPW